MAVATQVVRLVIQYGQKAGVPKERMCILMGISPEELEQPDRQVDLKPFIQLWESLPELAGDPLFGLHFGMNFNPPASGILAYFLHSCETVGEALQEFSRYYRVLGDFFRVTMELQDGQLAIRLSQPEWERISPESAKQGIEGRFAIMINLIRSLSGKQVFPSGVFLKREFPVDSNDFQGFFGPNIYFKQKENLLELDGEVLKLPVLSSNLPLKELLGDRIEQMLRAHENSRRFSDRLRYLLFRSGGGRFPDIGTCARQLNVSTRTLQRRLKEEGANYQQISDEVKIELSKQYLQNGLPVSEVSFLLGYADIFSFSHFFKNKTGINPSQFKAL